MENLAPLHLKALGNPEFHARYYKWFNKSKQTYHFIYFSQQRVLHVFNCCMLQDRMWVTTYDTHCNWSPCWSQWEDPEHWTSIEHQEHMLVTVDSKALTVLHVVCTSWCVPGAGHSCFVTGRAGKNSLMPAAYATVWPWGGQKKCSCWTPSVSLLEVNLILFLTVTAPETTGLKDFFSSP